MARHGHHVTLLAPGDGERVVDGVNVVGVGRADVRRHRMTRLVARIGDAIEALRPDVVVLHDPELLRLGFRRRRPAALVYDAHEDYAAQIRDKEWIPAVLRRLAGAAFGRLELLATRRVSAVFCATPAIRRRFAADRSMLVLNRPLLADAPRLDVGPGTARGAEPARVLYVGDLRLARGARALVEAMAIVNTTHDARLEIVGRLTPPSLCDELAQLDGWADTDVAGWRPRDEVYDALTRADVAVLPFLALANHVESQPNKLFEYMMMGLPVAATDFPLWIELAGACSARFEGARSDDARSLAAAIVRLLDDPPTASQRRQAAERARACYSWEAIEDEYVRNVERVHREATPT